ncbi:MAG: ribonuclease III [Candidatus Moranbacteria bacterium]|nr:ribonuclease III [Candidatus Moranbacteria bacterium]
MNLNLKDLEKKLQIDFKDKKLIKKALTHRSYLNEHRNYKLEHNERFEFLGDAVLELIVTEYLFDKFPHKPEGELTNLRAALVKGENLTKIAKELKLGDFLYLSRGEAKGGGRSRSYILANTVEAVIGAIYLDQGYNRVKVFIEENIIKELPVIIEDQLFKDPKSLFQEKAQEQEGITPSYELVSQKGPDHDKFFEIGVFLEDEFVAKGKGKSKQEAQQMAAKKALEKKGWSD